MYFTIYGTCESIDDASYPRQVEQEDGTTTTETVPQNQITLSVPGMRDVVKVTFAGDIKVSQEWEDKMQMLKVTCDKYTVSNGIRNKKAWTVVGFHGLTVQIAEGADLDQITKARKAAKVIAHQRKAAAQAAKLGKTA